MNLRRHWTSTTSCMPPWIPFLFLGDLLVAGGFIAVVWAAVPPGKLQQFFDMDEEANLGAWYSSIKLAVSALLVAFYAWRQGGRSRRQTRLAWLLALLLLAFSLDEAAQVHEWIGYRMSLLFADGPLAFFETTHSWTFLLAIPVLAGVLWMLRELSAFFSPAKPATLLLIAGFAVFFASAEGLELLVELSGAKALWYAAEVCLEELGELFGENLMVWAGSLLALHAAGIPVRKAPAAL